MDNENCVTLNFGGVQIGVKLKYAANPESLKTLVGEIMEAMQRYSAPSPKKV